MGWYGCGCNCCPCDGDFTDDFSTIKDCWYDYPNTGAATFLQTGGILNGYANSVNANDQYFWRCTTWDPTSQIIEVEVEFNNHSAKGGGLFLGGGDSAPINLLGIIWRATLTGNLVGQAAGRSSQLLAISALLPASFTAKIRAEEGSSAGLYDVEFHYNGGLGFLETDVSRASNLLTRHGVFITPHVTGTICDFDDYSHQLT